MQKVYKFLWLAFITSLVHISARAQETRPDTTITSIDADLINLTNPGTPPKKYKIVSIKVSGNHFFDENLLVSISGINTGDEVTLPGGDLFSKAINKLWAQNYFSDVKIYLTGVKEKNLSIEIAVQERPRLNKFYFRGVKKGDSEDLASKTGLVAGRVVTENMKRSAVEAIKKFYAEKGFQNAQVRIELKMDSARKDYVSVYFNINKGDKVHVNNINFEGNDNILASQLKGQMKDTKEKQRLTLYPSIEKGGFINPKPYTFQQYLEEHGYLTYTKTKRLLDPYVRIKPFVGAKFNEKKLSEDLDKIIEYYNSLGYRDAAIVKYLPYPNSKGDINIDIKLTEGHKYYFGNISWRGNTKYPDSVLTSILGIHKGDIYNLDLLNKKLGKGGAPEGGDVSGLYMDDGYLFFRTDPVETAVYNDTIDYEIRMVEGPQATIKNVRITGNEKTKEFVIRRELRTIPGEKFSRTDLIRSQREIVSLGFFNQEKVTPDVVPSPEDGTVDINWKVEEKSSDQLELSAGWGGTIGLTGTVGITFNNFSIKNIWKKSAWDPLPMGDGQKISLRVQSNGRAFRSYSFSFTEPWLGGKKRNSLTTSIYDTKYSNAYDPVTRTYTSAAANNSYIRTTGIGVTLGKQLKWPDDFFTLSMGVNYARYKLKNYYIDPYNLRNFNNGFSNNLSFKIAIQRNSLNQPLFPTNGSSYLASLQITPPYSWIDQGIVSKQHNPLGGDQYKWIEYHKWRFTGDWYVPLTQGHGEDRNKVLVFRAAAKLGFIGRYNPGLEISPFERFQVGDAGLSNQYAILGYDIISQRGYPVYYNSNPTQNQEGQTPQYFTIFNKYTLELRYPLSLNPSSTIYGLGFFEAANGWFSLQDYNPFRLRRSVGLGMRFFLPMFGLLGFDYGLGLDNYQPGQGLKGMGRFTFMLGFEPE